MKKKSTPIEMLRFNLAGYQAKLKDLNGEVLPNLKQLAFRPLKHGGTTIGTKRKSLGHR
jgi:hypothetical protein